MFDLIPAQVPAPGALTIPEIDTVRRFAENEKAASSRRAYDSDWRLFRAWAAARDLAPLPAEPTTIAAFLAAEAERGTKASTIGRRLAAIRCAHGLAGFSEPPTNSELVKATVRGVRRTLGTAPVRKAACSADVLGGMLKHIRTDRLLGLRDRALLTLGFAGAFRRSELVALRVEDLTETKDGLLATILRSKTDQEGQGAEIAILRGVKICPVEAVQTWLARAEISSGPVFRAVTGGTVSDAPLTAQVVALRVKRYARLFGLDVAQFSGHSLRAGFCTSAAEHGAPIFKILDISRHKSVDVLRGYVRRADSFKDHAGAAFLWAQSMSDRGNRSREERFMPCGSAKEMNVILPVEGYPVSDKATREWFRRTHGREASEVELGEILNALAERESQQIEVGDWR